MKTPRWRVRTLVLGTGGAPPVRVVAVESAERRSSELDFMLPCYGTGATVRIARRRALAEASERFAGIFTGREVRVRGTYEDLAPAAIHPSEYLLFSDDQHRKRWYGGYRIPGSFPESTSVEWTALREALEGRIRYLPTQLLYYGYDAPRGHTYGHATSNGCAYGKTKAQASLRGLLELIERDSVAQWWYNRSRRPRIDLSAFRSDRLRRMRSWLVRAHRDVWALDLTSDLGIPCVAAISSRSTSGDGVALGFGAALSRVDATLHAFHELFQMLTMFDDAARSRMPLPAPARRWFKLQVRDHPFLAPLETTTGVGRSYRFTSPAASFRWLCRRLREHGVAVYVLDQARGGDAGLTVRVVAPGLRFWWPAFAPGRLFEAPIRAGWQRRATRRTRLNPHAAWF